MLRLLRFFRFHAWYGRTPPDADALAACRAMAERLPGLSAERIWSELRRILLAPDPAAALELMAENGILDHVLSEARMRPRLAALVEIERRLELDADTVRRLIAVLELAPDAAPALARRLRLSRKESVRISDNIDHADALSADMDGRACRKMLHLLGADLFRDRVLIGWAGDGDDAWEVPWRAAEDWRPVAFPLNGADVFALGVTKGPGVGRILRRVEDWWIEQDFQPDRAACLQRLAEEATNEGKA